ncbi:hypothetical protein LTR28_008504, partial [Elasticomyces elasticus]
MDGASTPHSPRPKPLPSYLTNGLTNGHSPLHNTMDSRDQRERDNTIASIKSSMGPRKQPVDLDQPNGYFSSSKADGTQKRLS